MSYLPPQHAVEGSTDLAVEYMHERLPSGHRGRRRLAPDLRPGEHEDPLVRALVCVSVPMTGGTIVLTDDGQAIDTRYLGFTDQPARVRRRGGGPSGRDVGRRVGRPHRLLAGGGGAPP